MNTRNTSLFALFVFAIIAAFAQSALAGAQDFTYSLTVDADPATPGQVVTYVATVTNNTTSTQDITLNFTVPGYTVETYNSSQGAGSSGQLFATYIDAGASASATLHLTVLSGATTAPPDGANINLTLLDEARGQSISRSFTVERQPPFVAKLSSSQASVAPGQQFTYSAEFSSLAAVSGVVLSLPVPVGSSLVSADQGGVLGSDNIVRWSLGQLITGSSGQLHATFQVSNSSVAVGQLPLEAQLSDSAGDIARASAIMLIDSAPAFTYSLTASADPAAPGQVVTYVATVTNNTTSTQDITLNYTVPGYTVETYNSSQGAGSSGQLFATYIDAGASASTTLHLTVLSGATTAPPDGSNINLILLDEARGKSLSRSFAVKRQSPFVVELSSAQASVTPGQQFTYSAEYSSVAAVSGAVLALPVPAGSSLVSADQGGVLGNDNIVRWPLGALTAGSTGQLNATFKVGSSSVAVGQLPLDAELSDSAGDIARASAIMLIDSAPAFTYSLTASADPVAPGQAVTYVATVTNNTSSTQDITLYFTVPDYTVETNDSSQGAGSLEQLFGTYIDAGASASASVTLTVLSGTTTAPPDGTNINLKLLDEARGESLSTSVVVKSPPIITSADTATVVQGTPFSYQITATENPTSFSVTGLPQGVSFDPTSGLISGTPSQVGNFAVLLTATNGSGSGTLTLSLTVTAAPVPAPAITSSSTATAPEGAAFSYQITATQNPTSFAATGLPQGLSVDATTGLISGVPTQSGNFGVLLTATNGSGSGTLSLSLTVTASSAPAPVLTSANSATAQAGAAFSYQIAATNFPTSYGATGLPQGLSVNTATGLVSGTPSQSGIFTVNLSATNGGGTGSGVLTLTIAPVPATVGVVAKGNAIAVEDGARGKFFITRDSSTINSDLNVYFKLKGTAQNGVDYKEISSSVTIPAGSLSAKVKIVVVNNSFFEGTRTVILKLVPSPNGAYVIGSPKKATIFVVEQ